MVACMVAVPAPVVLRVLPPVIEASVVPGLYTLQVMVLLVAELGTTVPTSVSGCNTVAVVGMPVMSVTATNAGPGVKVSVVPPVAESVPVAPVTVRLPVLLMPDEALISV